MKDRRARILILLISLLLICVAAGCGGRSKKDLENELAYRQLGINKMNEGDYEEAVRMFQKALDQSMAVVGELEIDISYYKAAAQYKAGDTAGAMDTYGALIDYDKKNADAWYLRGILYLEQGDTKAAMDDFENALNIDKKNRALYNKIGERLKQAGLTEEAGEILNRGLSLKGETAADDREKGYACMLLEQYDSAETYLTKANEGKDAEAGYYLGKLYEVQGEYDKALVYFQAALENGTSANERALRRDEIIALEHTLDFAQAREKMESYLEDYPDDQEAAREYEFLKSR